MSLSPEEILLIKKRLLEAETAYHEVMMGKGTAEVRDSDGSSIRYTTANASRLKAYIAELKGLLLDCDAQRTNKLPLRPVWG